MKIAIASGKGGTGKTTISTNLATYSASQRKTVLADLDVEEPNSSIFIKSDLFYSEKKYKMIPTWDRDKCLLCNDCKENCKFNALIRLANELLIIPELCHSCYACSELCPSEALPMMPVEIGLLQHHKINNIDFIESRLNIGQEQSVPLISQTLRYIECISNKSTFVIMDSPPGTSCPMIEVIKNADYVIFVTEPTPFGLNDLRLAVDTVKLIDKPFSVIINRANESFFGIDEYCRQENIEIISRIPEDRDIAYLSSKGILLIDKHENFTTEIQKLYYKIQEIERQ